MTAKKAVKEQRSYSSQIAKFSSTLFALFKTKIIRAEVGWRVYSGYKSVKHIEISASQEYGD